MHNKMLLRANQFSDLLSHSTLSTHILTIFTIFHHDHNITDALEARGFSRPYHKHQPLIAVKISFFDFHKLSFLTLYCLV